MEQKLAEYRLKKWKDKDCQNFSDLSVTQRKPSLPLKNNEADVFQPSPAMIQTQSGSSLASDRASLLSRQADTDFFVASSTNDIDSSATTPPTSIAKTKYDRYLYLASNLLQLLLWSLLMVIFVKLEFGAVFFVISLLYVLWSTLRNRPRKEGEPSAYSVFNPNCERIDGTLTAEQFEREIRFQT